MKKTFHPQQWLNNKTANNETGIASPAIGEAPVSRGAHHRQKDPDAEQVILQIESRQTDITANYADWRNIGFAFADAFGESGRAYFHRVSRFYPEYKSTDCDRQYTACLKSTGHGITLKTFFYLARQAGIDIADRGSFLARQAGNDIAVRDSFLARQGGNDIADRGSFLARQGGNDIADRGSFLASQAGSDIAVRGSLSSPLQGEVDRRQTGRRGQLQAPADHPDDTPIFPASIFPNLPEFLQKILTTASSDEERDILLLGSLATLSSCIPNVYGIYDGKKVYPNLYLFISAQASAGKGRLVHCRQLVNPIHKMLRRQARILKQQYEMERTEFNATKKNKSSSVEKPEKPKEKMLFIPANNSTTGVFQLMSDNDGRGLIFETEGDTLAQAFKSDYGNYSDGFRKAFHHETISYYRRTDREYVDIENPCLSTVLSGTPGQIASLIPSAENGLFSRFIFYFMNIKPGWKNVFETSAANGLDDYFSSLGDEYLELYNVLLTTPEMEFILSPGQQQQFNSFFEQIQTTYLTLQGIDYMATIRRLGLIAFRMAMVMSALRIMETGEFPGQLTCTDRDLTTILSMIIILIQHSSRVFSGLPEEERLPGRKNYKDQFFRLLPSSFNRQKYLEAARQVPISPKTADVYIAEFVKNQIIQRTSQGNYINPEKEQEPGAVENKSSASGTEEKST